MRWQRGLWLFLVPSFGLMALVLLWPLGYAASLSTFDYYLGSREMRFVGLANYVQLLGEARLWQSLWTTIVIALGSVGVEFAVGFALAFALYRLTFSVRVFMILLFLPHIITPVVATLFLKWILTSNWGLIDATLMTFNIGPRPDWLGDPVWAKISSSSPTPGSLRLLSCWCSMPPCRRWTRHKSKRRASTAPIAGA